MRDRTEQDIYHFLKNIVDRTLIEEGISLFRRGGVTDAVKENHRIKSCVRSGEDVVTTCLFLNGDEIIKGDCSCLNGYGGWCEHSIALFCAALERGMLEPDSGFDRRSSLIPYVGGEIDQACFVLTQLQNTLHGEMDKVLVLDENDFKIIVINKGDRIGFRLSSGDYIISPLILSTHKITSNRQLDLIFTDLLREEGIWDNEAECFIVNDSNTIEKAVGFLCEYDNVYIFTPKNLIKKLRISDLPIDAKLVLHWKKSCLVMTLEWVLPNGTRKPRREDVIGSGPHWAIINDVLYKLTEDASLINSIFIHSLSCEVPIHKTGRIIQALDELPKGARKKVAIKGKTLIPPISVGEPIPVLEFVGNNISEVRELGSIISLEARFSFEYKQTQDGTVIVPNRDKESEFTQKLRKLGFSYDPVRGIHEVVGEDAMNVLSEAKEIFPPPWRILGLEHISGKLKIASLILRLDVKRDKSGDSFDLRFSLLRNSASIPISMLFKHRKSSSNKWVFFPEGIFARVPCGNFAKLEALLSSFDANFWSANVVRGKLDKKSMGFLSLISQEHGVQIRAEDNLLDSIAKLDSFSGIKKIKPSKGFKGKLRKYQYDGISWLNFIHDYNFGGILADEMGLGKTVQTLAFLQYLKDTKGLGPTLIVVPTSIIANWRREAEKFTPNLKVLVLHGPNRKQLFQEIPYYDIILTSYPLVRIDKAYLCRYDYDYIILDEAQYIKNEAASVTKAVKSLISKHRLALTGTPTENRPLELWSIFDFLMPKYLGTRESFKKYFEKPILENTSASTDIMEYLNARIMPFVLARKKSEVAKDLPPKIESVVFADMTDEQRSLYNDMLCECRMRVFEEVQTKGIARSTVCILAALLRLRQICNHPQSIEAFQNESELGSGKFNAAMDLIGDALHEGRKILLYSQFVSMLRIFKRELDNKGISYYYLDGSTKNRQEIVDSFNHDPGPSLFLLSLKAGGTGLNLTGADTVILYDPWWNPAVEEQAADRTHRIGQHKVVTVYRLVTENSVESHIMALKKKKEQITKALLDAKGLSPLNLTKRDLERIFSL